MIDFRSSGQMIDNGTCGRHLIWMLFRNGTLVISGTGAMEDYVRIIFPDFGAPWQEYREQICYIVVRQGVTRIGDTAFAGSRINEISFPEGLTSIGKCAFLDCNCLTSISFPKGLTKIENAAFQSCNNLESILFSEANMTIGEAAFNSCDALREIWYTGSEKQWNEMAVLPGNDKLLKAKIHFHAPAYEACEPELKELLFDMDTESYPRFQKNGLL